MPSLPSLLAGAVLGSLVIYALLGGADFGGGSWDLLARGPRGGGQRRLIALATRAGLESHHFRRAVLADEPQPDPHRGARPLQLLLIGLNRFLHRVFFSQGPTYPRNR